MERREEGMSSSSLYPSDRRSDAEIRDSRKKVQDELRASFERDQLKREAKDREAREARRKVEEAEREAKAKARAEAEIAEVTAWVGDPAALVRMVLALKAEIAAMKAGLPPMAEPPAFMGQFISGTMHGARAPLEPIPQRDRSGWHG